MAEQILPGKALEHIEPIILEICKHFDKFDESVQAKIDELYALMRRDYAAAKPGYQQGAVVVRFLESIETLPGVRNVLADLLDATKGRVTRGGSVAGDATLLERLPPEAKSLGWESANGDTRNVEVVESNGDGAEPPQTDTPRPPLVRYPELDYPSEVVIASRSSLTVSLLLEPTSEEARASSFAIADVAEEPPKLEVVLRARGFDIEGSNTQMLEVSRESESSVRFVLTPRQEGECVIRVDFYQNGQRPIGGLERKVRVVTQPSLAPALPEAASVAVLELSSVVGPVPDLELFVETDPQDPRKLSYTLHSTQEDVDFHHLQVGSVQLGGTPLEKVQEVYKELSQFAGAMPASTDDQTFQKDRLASWGRTLWDQLFSNDLKNAYWQFKDKVKTFVITSTEPWIPWEMVKPYRFDQDNNRLDEPFLCEQFVMARWLAGPGMSEKFSVQRVRPVVPQTDLQAVQEELRYLEQLNLLKPGITPDTPYSERVRVLDLLENGAFNVLHFATHGNFDAQIPENSAITLQGGELHPLDIAVRFGGKKPRPLVFINACHGARMSFAFTGLGGWAKKLVCDARVAAFVGAAWEVNDRLALLFAQEFYAAFLKDGETMGESFRRARTKIRDAEPSNSTYLAYVLYADPSAKAFVPTQ